MRKSGKVHAGHGKWRLTPEVIRNNRRYIKNVFQRLQRHEVRALILLGYSQQHQFVAAQRLLGAAGQGRAKLRVHRCRVGIGAGEGGCRGRGGWV